MVSHQSAMVTVLTLMSSAIVDCLPSDNGALYLTPMIMEGNLDMARTMSRVLLTHGMTMESYSGFLTVKAPDDGHMFFWFFPALENKETAPVILWMNGGPGTSAMEGLFYEIGPYSIDGVELRPRKVNWTNKFNVIFMDTPLGTGFSHVNRPSGYSSTSEQIGRDLHSAVLQFFTLFNEYRGRDFYVAGESYAAKYAITMATEFRNQSAVVNLKGLLMLSSYYDPINQMENVDYAYETGMISKETRDAQRFEESVIKGAIQLNMHAIGYQALELLAELQKRSPGIHGLEYAETGMINSLNILYDEFPIQNCNYERLLNIPEIRQALHIGDVHFRVSVAVTTKRLGESGDLTKSFRPQLEVLLNDGYRVLAVAGNMDWLIPPARSWDAAEALQWSCADAFRHAKRIVWKVNQTDKTSAGYVQCACGYCYSLIRNAGHFLPMDQPVQTLNLVTRFIEGTR